MKDRERWLSATMIELADTLACDYDLAELLSTLAESCAKLLEVAEVGIVIADGHGALHAMASTTERARELELLELQRNEGPCLDCILGGEPIQARLLDDAALTRWPTFQPAAVEAGYRQVLALPMRLRMTTIGAVNLFLDDPRKPPAADRQLAQRFADITTIGILQERANSESTVLATQLRGALDSRIVIEQAKGMLAQHLGMSVDDAFHLLRGYVRSQNRRLSDVARAIATRQLALERLSTVTQRSGVSRSSRNDDAAAPRSGALRRTRGKAIPQPTR